MNQASKKVSDLTYLSNCMAGNKKLIREIMDVFLKQAPEEMMSLNKGVDKQDYELIRRTTHTMKSSVSIMGIASLVLILKQIQDLAICNSDMLKISQLKNEADSILKQAIDEIVEARKDY